MKRLFKTLMGAVAGLSIATSAMAADITGAGSSFVFPIVAKWASVYTFGPTEHHPAQPSYSSRATLA